jgi:hypothetical protein
MHIQSLEHEVDSLPIAPVTSSTTLEHQPNDPFANCVGHNLADTRRTPSTLATLAPDDARCEIESIDDRQNLLSTTRRFIGHVEPSLAR